MKVIVVHGIKRSNRWYEDLQAMEVVKQERIKIIPYDYGHFSGVKFIRKKKRQEIVDGFVTFYNNQISANEAPPSVIAHSFGTAVVFHAMKQYDVVKFDNIILCGSILNSRIDLRPYCESNQFNKIINDHGSKEWFVGYTRLLSKEYGNLGEVGFKDVPPQFKNRIINRASHKRHSDYFMPLSMQKNWINELIKSRAIQDFNIMILRKEVIDRIYLRSFQSDTPFEINSIRFNARIDLDGNYYAKYEFDGLNNTNIALENYNFATAADGIHDLNTMNFRVYDRHNNLLEFEEIEDYNHKKTIKIRLLNLGCSVC